MPRGMSLPDAKAECERWFAYLKRQEDKCIAIQKISASVRSGEITSAEGQRKLRSIDNCNVTVFDGANLEKAVRVLLKHVP